MTPKNEIRKIQAKCRGCGRILIGKPYAYSSIAYHPETGERVKINYYGGFVCSEQCDIRACLELERSMPGHTSDQKTLDSNAQRAVDRNWKGNDEIY